MGVGRIEGARAEDDEAEAHPVGRQDAEATGDIGVGVFLMQVAGDGLVSVFLHPRQARQQRLRVTHEAGQGPAPSGTPRLGQPADGRLVAW